MGLFNLVSVRELRTALEQQKEEIVMAISEEIAGLRQSVEDLVGRVAAATDGLIAANEDLRASLEEERRLAAELAAAEDAEDVEQNAALEEARAATDAALKANDDAVTEIANLRETVDGTLAEDGEGPGDQPAPPGDLPAEVPETDPEAEPQEPVDGPTPTAPPGPAVV